MYKDKGGKNHWLTGIEDHIYCIISIVTSMHDSTITCNLYMLYNACKQTSNGCIYMDIMLVAIVKIYGVYFIK